MLRKTQETTNAEVILFDSKSEDIEMKISSEAMAHVISRLTDLYANPILATIREVISNALDATQLLDKKDRKQVIVNLPNSLSENFIVKDFGVGMSKEDIKTIYSQYGASTKKNNLGQIGAYGLGAKAPLSYCSQFVVNSTQDGITTEIIVSNEADGNFTKIVSSEYTGDESGTTVTIPVRSTDFSEFERFCKSKYKFMTEDSIYFAQIPVTKTKLVSLGSIEIEKDVSVRVFCAIGEKTTFTDFVLHSNKTIFEQFSYILSNFHYNNPLHYRGADTLLVELIPGVVDFSSSRDEITRNYRSEELNKIISNNIDGLITKKIQEEVDSELISINTLYSIFVKNDRYFSYFEGLNEIRDGRKDTKGKKGQTIKDYVRNYDVKSPFFLTLRRDHYNKSINVINFNRPYYNTRLTLKNIDDNEYKQENSAISFSYFETLDTNNKIIITDMPNDKKPTTILRKSSVFRGISNHLNQTGDFYFLFTNDTKDDLTKKIGEFGSFDTFEVISYDKYMEKVRKYEKENRARRVSTKNETELATFSGAIIPNISLSNFDSFSSILKGRYSGAGVKTKNRKQMGSSENAQIVYFVDSYLYRKDLNLIVADLYTKLLNKNELIDVVLFYSSSLLLRDLDVLLDRHEELVLTNKEMSFKSKIANDRILNHKKTRFISEKYNISIPLNSDLFLKNILPNKYKNSFLFLKNYIPEERKTNKINKIIAKVAEELPENFSKLAIDEIDCISIDFIKDKGYEIEEDLLLSLLDLINTDNTNLITSAVNKKNKYISDICSQYINSMFDKL